MSIREREMKSVMLFDHWRFGHTTSFLRATVKKQNCYLATFQQGDNVLLEAGNNLT